MLTLQPIDRNRQIRPIRLHAVHRIRTGSLALAVSAVAAATAGVLSATTEVSGGSLVLGTLAVGFTASWVNTALPSSGPASGPARRPASEPVRLAD